MDKLLISLIIRFTHTDIIYGLTQEVLKNKHQKYFCWMVYKVIPGSCKYFFYVLIITEIYFCISFTATVIVQSEFQLEQVISFFIETVGKVSCFCSYTLVAASFHHLMVLAQLCIVLSQFLTFDCLALRNIFAT